MLIKEIQQQCIWISASECIIGIQIFSEQRSPVIGVDINQYLYIMNKVQKVGNYQLLMDPYLGKGAAATVYYGINKVTRQKVAAKKIDINKITPHLEKQIESEIKNLVKLESPFIVRLYQYFRCENYIYLFLQYCEDGDLAKYAQLKKKQGIVESEALLFMRHIIEGYRVLYDHRIIHRDIKPANILLKQGVAKLSDFGFSREVEDPNKTQKLTLLGTPIYTAIQILMGSTFCSKCDVWSCGAVLYELMNGRTPWTGKDINDLKENIQKKPLTFSDNCKNPKIKDLIHSMLRLDKKERMSWQEIFNHPLFSEKMVIKPAQKTADYNKVKVHFIQYIKSNGVKSYLIRDTKNVKFRDSFDFQDSKSKSKVQEIHTDILHRRNTAFMYAYLLALYFNCQQLISKNVNACMQFEYALASKALRTIKDIATIYFSGKPPGNIPQALWYKFKNCSRYDEEKQTLRIDYDELQLIKDKIHKEAVSNFQAKKLPQKVIKYYQHLDKDFNTAFPIIMKQNLKALRSDSKSNVSMLLALYIQKSILQPQEIENNIYLDFGAMYAAREREYGLS